MPRAMKVQGRATKVEGLPPKVLGLPAGKEKTANRRAKTNKKTADSRRAKTADSRRAKSKKKMADSRAKTTGKKGHPKVSAAILKLQQDIRELKGDAEAQLALLCQLRYDISHARGPRRNVERDAEFLDICMKTHSERISAVEEKVLGNINGRPQIPPTGLAPSPTSTSRVCVPDKNAPKFGDYRCLK